MRNKRDFGRDTRVAGSNSWIERGVGGEGISVDEASSWAQSRNTFDRKQRADSKQETVD